MAPLDDQFVLDASALTAWQTCRRRFLLASEWLPARWRPKSLFDSCLRRAVHDLSSGRAVADVVAEARARFLSVAASPGLDAEGVNVYVLAKDWCATLSTVLYALSRLTLLVPHAVAPVALARRVEWRVLAEADDSGELHRWLTVDAWSEDALARACHEWTTAGDMAATGQPMTLHAIEIGRTVKGRRISPWARGYKNTIMPSLQARFAKPREGSKRADVWKAAWLADDLRLDAEKWVDHMHAEGVAQKLVHHVRLRALADTVAADTRRQMLAEASAMREASAERASAPWSAWPMSRGACDLRGSGGGCAYQRACYQPNVVRLGDIGGFVRRTLREREPAPVAVG